MFTSTSPQDATVRGRAKLVARHLVAAADNDLPNYHAPRAKIATANEERKSVQ